MIDSKRDDFGYPSSVQRADGLIVTAWYEGFKKPDHLEPGDYRIGRNPILRVSLALSASIPYAVLR